MPFNDDIFNPPSGGAGTVGVPLSSLIMPAYKIAGIATLPGTTLPDEWFNEAVPELNRMVGTLNCERLNIFTIRIDAFHISDGQKKFTIGAGADFDMPRPQRILEGVIILGDFNTPGVVRMKPMRPLSDREWARVTLQDVPNGIPLAFYYDGSYDANGWGVVYLWTQTNQSYSVEWYTWQSIPAFGNKDDVVTLPPNAEDLLVYNLAERLAALNPRLAHMSADSYRIAARNRAAWQHINADPPEQVTNDAANVGRRSAYRSNWNYLTGNF